MLSMMAMGRVTSTPMVKAAASENVVMVTAAPSMLMVAPSGMDTEYISSSSPRSSQSSILTGMLAAELLVKKAVRPLLRMQRKTRG